MKEILLIAHYLIVLGAIGFMLYVFLVRKIDREIDRIRQKRAEAMRKVYLARKSAVERQARQRL